MRRKRSPKSFREQFTNSAQTRIGNRRHRLGDESGIRRLLARSSGGPAKRFAISSEVRLRDFQVFASSPNCWCWANSPSISMKSPSLQRTAGLVIRMIIPNPQHHSIARVGQADFAIWFPFARGLRRCALTCAWTRAVTNPFCVRWRTSLIVSSSIIPRLLRSRFGHANYPAGETTTGIASRLRFQIIGFFMHNHSATHDRISTGKFHHLVAPF